MMRFSIDPDITRAHTLPASFYADPASYHAQLERVFARTFHFVGDSADVVEPGAVVPLTLLEGSLNEPIVLTRDGAQQLHALSNVCTHRGALVANERCVAKSLLCRYHGRRFDLDGRFKHMPRFEEAQNFPTKNDDLPPLTAAPLGPVVFASLSPKASFSEVWEPFRPWLDFLPLGAMRPDLASSRDYLVRAHWALYCDNYLEGFHIPFVHPGLTRTLSMAGYRTQVLPYGTLQIARGAAGEPAFELPPAHIDAADRISAYYAWLFPATMLNFYPWGLSLNAIRPLGPDRTMVSFRSYVYDASLRERGAGGALHQVEMEDEAVVESAQRGVRSRLYKGGRFSPREEEGVHAFHGLLARFMNDD